MKSQTDGLLSIVHGICKDIRGAYPNLKGLDLDLERLSRLVSSRGLGVFTLDLPLRETSLIRGLEDGLLPSSGTERYSKRYPVPRLFAGLYMRIFDRDLRLRSDADVNAIAFLRQILCLGKKIEVPCSKSRTAQAIKDYIDVERQLVGPTLTWGLDSLDSLGVRSRVHLCDSLADDLPLYPEYNIGRNARDKLLLQRCQQVADVVSEWLGTFCPDCFIEANRSEARRLGLRHGPGAVAEKSGRFFDKYRFSNWSAKLQSMYPWETTGKMPNDSKDKPQNHEVPARLICVPKTAKGPRIIAAEPSEHMFTQNLFATWLIESINSSPLGKFIDLRDQTKSGSLVLKASLDQSLATIDLSSASDRLSLWVIERLFRKNPSLTTAIHATRTRWLRLPNGEALELKKFASQGTALTFPVQTLAFLIIAIAACSDKAIKDPRDLRKLVGKVRVYGDDIIIPTHGYADTVALLTTLQLKVNPEKSFSRGYFRESCGVDAFKGYDITPIKPKTTVPDNPASCQAVLDTINNLFCKGYWNASKQLEHRQPTRMQQSYGLVGRDAGATGYVSFSFDTYAKRWLFELSQVFERDQKWISADGADNGRTLWGRVANHSRKLQFILESTRTRLRYNRSLHRFETRRSAFSSGSRIRPYDCGFTGLLDGQLRPLDPQSTQSVGVRGVPERPNLRKVIRWEALDLLCSRS